MQSSHFAVLVLLGFHRLVAREEKFELTLHGQKTKLRAEHAGSAGWGSTALRGNQESVVSFVRHTSRRTNPQTVLYADGLPFAPLAMTMWRAV